MAQLPETKIKSGQTVELVGGLMRASVFRDGTPALSGFARVKSAPKTTIHFLLPQTEFRDVRKFEQFTGKDFDDVWNTLGRDLPDSVFKEGGRSNAMPVEGFTGAEFTRKIYRLDARRLRFFL